MRYVKIALTMRSTRTAPSVAARELGRYTAGLLMELMVEKLVEYKYPNFVVTTCIH